MSSQVRARLGIFLATPKQADGVTLATSNLMTIVRGFMTIKMVASAHGWPGSYFLEPSTASSPKERLAGKRAVDASIDRTYVGGIERGTRNPTVAVLDRLAAALAVPISQFFLTPGAGSAHPRPSGGRRPK